MKHSTRLRLLIGVDAALAVLLAVGLSVNRTGGDAGEPLFAVTADTVTAIDLRAGGLVLERDAGRWDLFVAAGVYPARSDRVEGLVEELATARVVRRVTDDPTLHARFGVDESARQVEVRSLAGGGAILVGTRAGDDSVYVRRVGSPVVWVAEAAIDFYLDRHPTYWAYLRLAPESVRPDEVVGIVVDRAVGDDYELTLDADGEQWELRSTGQTGTGAASAAAAGSLARQVADLVGSGFYDGSWDELAPFGSVRFSLADGRTFVYEVRASDELFVVAPGGPALPGEGYGGLLYTIDAAIAARLLPEVSTLERRP